MNSVYQPLDHPELDEAPDIDVVEDREALIHMHLKPFLDGAASAEGGEETAEVEIGKAGPVDVHVIGALILQAIFIGDEIVDFRSRGVDVAEEEEIEH